VSRRGAKLQIPIGVGGKPETAASFSIAKLSSYLMTVGLIILSCVSCGKIEPTATYHPPFLPIEIVASTSGIEVKGDLSIATFIGTFSVGARYLLPPADPHSIYVILRNNQTGYDHIYELRTGSEQLSVVVNGKTTVAVTTSRVTVDLAYGKIESIRFRRATAPPISSGTMAWYTTLRNKVAKRWDEGWSQSWYKPLGLTKWAYDDSTIKKWYGGGFALFLIRLIFAVICFVIDLVLMLGFLVGQLAFILLGPTGRNVIYGFLVLGALVGAGWIIKLALVDY
jgi:hypothetical protein